MMEFTCKGGAGAAITKSFPTWTQLYEWIGKFYAHPGNVTTIHMDCAMPLAEVRAMADGELDLLALSMEMPVKAAQLVEKFGRCSVCSVFPTCTISRIGCAKCPEFKLDYIHGGAFIPDSPESAHCKCKKCGWEWTKKVAWEPRSCPQCKSQSWNKEYKYNMKGKK